MASEVAPSGQAGRSRGWREASPVALFVVGAAPSASSTSYRPWVGVVRVLVGPQGHQVEVDELPCAGQMRLFYDELNEVSVLKAKVICRGCEVQMHCLGEALERGERNGVWGGTTWPERKAILEVRRLAAR